MSKRLQVLLALKALVETALPGVTVLGMDPDDVKPATLPAGGLAWMESGDPGPAEIDLSPPSYHYDHDVPLALAFYQTPGTSVQALMDGKMALLGTAIVADRTLGGLCDYLDATAPTDGEIDKRGTVPLAWADLTITASYSTTSPLG